MDTKTESRTYIDTSRYWNTIAFPLFVVIILYGLYVLFATPKVQRIPWGLNRGFRAPQLPGLRYSVQ